MTTCKRHRLPHEIISYSVWLYYRVNLSHGDTLYIVEVFAGVPDHSAATASSTTFGGVLTSNFRSWSDATHAKLNCLKVSQQLPL
jgi:transposase-like protein